jgi:hypothetical protein
MKNYLFLLMMCAIVFGGMAVAEERAHPVIAEGAFPTG